MKKLINHKKFPEWLIIITISIIVSTINIFHVIIGQAQTPTGFTYMATGHYYLDYFEYLQHIAAGIDGRWMPTNYFTTESTLIDWRFFPYILLGKIAWLFHLSPITAYWIAVFILTILTLIGFYYFIYLIIPKETLYIRIIAFLLAIFSGPAYRVFINGGNLISNPYDFWYGPASFIRRFGVVPYHTLGLVLLLLIILALNKIWGKIPDYSNKTIAIKGFWIGLLMIPLMIFYPTPLISLIPTLFIISTIHFIKFKKDRFKLLLFNFTLLMLIIPVGFVIKQSANYAIINFEVKWIIHDPWWFVLLNLGPIILFFPFGFKDYVKQNSFLGQMLLVFSLVSYGFYFSPVAYYLGTHNLRFFSSISFICYGVLAVLGIKKISFFFKNHHKVVIILVSSLLIFYSCFLTFNSLNKRLLGFDQSTPVTVWANLPSSVIEGLKLLNRYPQANVIAGPYGGIGMLVPIFSYKRVYVGHPNPLLNPNIDKKQALSNLFYSGKMSEKEAVKFIKANKIGFVILTILDNFDANILGRYSFLKPIFVKPSIIIWKVI